MLTFVKKKESAKLKSHNGIIILGNGGGGTSLLRGLIHAHPKINIEFEYGKKLKLSPDKELENWICQANECACVWGNKVPIEQFVTRKWTDEDIVEIIEYFSVIWLFRRWSKYFKVKDKETWHETYKYNWERGQKLYWTMREKYPDKVIQVSFEDLLLRTEMELRRICCFLNIKYDPAMLTGCQNTGLKRYNQKKININKI